MHGIVHENPSLLLFLLITGLMGGLAAWQMGRAIAQTWRAFSALVLYAAMLTCGIRFLYFALFQGTLLSLHYFIVDFVAHLILLYRNCAVAPFNIFLDHGLKLFGNVVTL